MTATAPGRVLRKRKSFRDCQIQNLDRLRRHVRGRSADKWAGRTKDEAVLARGERAVKAAPSKDKGLVEGRYDTGIERERAGKYKKGNDTKMRMTVERQHGAPVRNNHQQVHIEKTFSVCVCVTMTDNSWDVDVFGEPLQEDEELEITDDEGEDENKDDGDDDDDDDNVSVNPWSELKQEVKDDMKTSLAEQEEEQEKQGASENDNSLLPSARRKLRRLYLRRLKWYNRIKQDKIHRQVMHTARRLMNEDGMDREEALEAAVDRRKFLLNRLINKPLLDESDDDDDAKKRRK
ncbi:hypothetical protein AWC38_SpisGene20735 [Stylophora pistillata]|uniref:Uncharacterized protein n=1 Tax=Stylophora pistillata TaxID=50429 RepID=A0A2B4RBM9_STYPI|nr:hypothetical protein AWC38_SpisGene20735 [Stylophora pistillata]